MSVNEPAVRYGFATAATFIRPTEPSVDHEFCVMLWYPVPRSQPLPDGKSVSSFSASFAFVQLYWLPVEPLLAVRTT